MTEKSYYFDTAGGDGALSPFSAAEFAEIINVLMLYDRRFECVLETVPDGTPLDFTTPGGTTARVNIGYALVDGRLYENDASIDFACPGAGHYMIYLERHLANQEVRMYVAGPQVAAYVNPTDLTQNAAQWQVMLHRFESTGAAIVNHVDERRYVPNNILPGIRMGGLPARTEIVPDLDWTEPGTREYKVGDLKMVCGSAVPALQTLVGLSDAGFICKPLVFAQLYSTQATIGPTIQPRVSFVDDHRFVITINSTTDVEAIFWLALGHTHAEYAWQD